MSFVFPTSPTKGQVFKPTGGPVYVWQGNFWQQQMRTALRRNRVANGSFLISQFRGDNSLLGAGWCCDCWYHSFNVAGNTTNNSMTRVSNAGPTPQGTLTRLRVSVISPKVTMAAGDYAQLFTAIEGLRVADLMWGTATAQPCVLRFGFRAPAGTYSICLRNDGSDRSFVRSFTVTAANAGVDAEYWFLIPGDTAGTWLKDTGVGIRLSIVYAIGATYVGGTNGAWGAGSFLAPVATNNIATAPVTFDLFDVGLYVDPCSTGVPPPWELPNYLAELRLCQRYWQKGTAVWGGQSTLNAGYYGAGFWPVPPRATPAMSGVSIAASAFAAATGTLGYYGHLANSFYDLRTASASGNGAFVSTVTGDARIV